MLLGRKLISPNDERKYTVDYDNWLETTETISAKTLAVSTGPATLPISTIASDGKSISFFLTGVSTSFTPFNVTIRVTTSIGQIRNDHIEFDVVAS